MQVRNFIGKLLLASAMVVATPSCSDEENEEVQEQKEEEQEQKEEEQEQKDDNYGVSISGKEGNYTYVDLGLSVKWATCNVGATKSTEYGDYFAWGETTPKEDYSWNTYKWSTDEGSTFTKYVATSDYGTIDLNTVLDAEDDAATANWGSEWRTPTPKEAQELLEGCEWEWVDNFNDSGVSGRLGTSKENGNTIFLPASGERNTTGHRNEGVEGYYWSSTLYQGHSLSAYFLNFKCDKGTAFYYDYRLNGRNVRAVLK